MRPEIERLEMPNWLNSDKFLFDINNVLFESLYYPCSGFDGEPIKYFMGNVFSFIYVDYGYSRQVFHNILETHGVKGYHVIHSQLISENELTPKGWNIVISPDKDEILNLTNSLHYIKEPFCEWLIFERNNDLDDSHNPKRFSLLYLCADGSSSYQALYLSNKVKPRIVTIIQPGSVGLNWTIFTRAYLKNEFLTCTL